MTIETNKKILTNYRSKLTMSILVATILLSSTLTIIPSAYSQPILFQDNYSTSAGWTQLGSVFVNSPSFPGVVKFLNTPGGGGSVEHRVFKQLPSTLPANNWIAEFDYKFTFSQSVSAFPFVLTYDELYFE